MPCLIFCGQDFLLSEHFNDFLLCLLLLLFVRVLLIKLSVWLLLLLGELVVVGAVSLRSLILQALGLLRACSQKR